MRELQNSKLQQDFDLGQVSVRPFFDKAIRFVDTHSYFNEKLYILFLYGQ